MALLIPSKKLLFIHIPKTGGMSIRHALMSSFGYEAIEIGHSHELMTTVVQMADKKDIGSCFSFAVVRNPYDWVVSVYNFMRESMEYNGVFQLVSDMSFDEFIYWFCDAVEKRKDILPFMPARQYEYIYDESGKQLVNCIGRFEYLNILWSSICEDIKFEANLRHLNDSFDKTSSKQRFINKDTKNKFEQTFKLDFELFNYPILWE